MFSKSEIAWELNAMFIELCLQSESMQKWEWTRKDWQELVYLL